MFEFTHAVAEFGSEASPGISPSAAPMVVLMLVPARTLTIAPSAPGAHVVARTPEATSDAISEANPDLGDDLGSIPGPRTCLYGILKRGQIFSTGIHQHPKTRPLLQLGSKVLRFEIEKENLGLTLSRTQDPSFEDQFPPYS